MITRSGARTLVRRLAALPLAALVAAGGAFGGEDGAALKKAASDCAKLEKSIAAAPNHFRALRKIIPLYHLLGRHEKAEVAAATLRKLHDERIVVERRFHREEFTVSESFAGSRPVERRVRVTEYFRPTAGRTSSRWPILWEFDALDADGKLIRKVFLEISLAATEIEKKTTYSLDENHWENGRMVYHAAYDFMEELPRYAALRARAIEILEGKAAIRSQSGRASSRYADAAAETKD